MTIMKRATIAMFAFAALLTAQSDPDPRKELAEIIAVEEQEGDLARAEKMYLAKIDSLNLSVPGRAYAHLRLGKLLQRLGREDEARPHLATASKSSWVVMSGEANRPLGQGQDVERQKELRAQARELISKINEQRGSHWGGPLHGIHDTAVASQLLWVGEAAVPEVIAALQEQGGRDPRLVKYQVISGLAGFLWHTGGDAAGEYLSSCTKVDDVDFREAVVRTAFQAKDERMMTVAALFLADPDESGRVVRMVMRSSGQQTGPLQYRLTPDVIVETALRGSSVAFQDMLQWAQQARVISAPVLARLHARIRELLRSTDPALGSAATRFVLSSTSQQSLEGVELVLTELPKMAGVNIPQWSHFGGERTPWTKEQARRLLPKLDACAKALGRAGSGPAQNRDGWMKQMMWLVATDHGPGCEAELLGWIDLGFDLWPLLIDRVDAGNAAEVASRVGQKVDHLDNALHVLGRADQLPAEVFRLLRDQAEDVRGTFENMSAFAWPMARTGNADAASWILAEWQRKPDKVWAVGPLVAIGRHARTENVRAALRALAAPAAKKNRDARAILALLAMGDEKALDLVVETVHRGARSAHPYESDDSRPHLSPLGYLIYDKVDPPHPFTDEQIHDVLRRVTKGDRLAVALQPKNFSAGAVADRHLFVLADKTEWLMELLRRTRDPRIEESRRTALRSWCSRVLRGDKPGVQWVLLDNLRKKDVEHFRAELEALLDGDDGPWAYRAAMHLASGVAKPDRSWRERLVKNRHPQVRSLVFSDRELLAPEDAEYIAPLLSDDNWHNRRMAAEFMGAIVRKESVPALIALLRDSEQSVRKAAADALTRIRFYHEQEAHWDRVLKGMDASPASAAEKLLLQAKPGQPKEQRILAIKSLGVLGRAEALPFLIEWASDADKEIAAQASAAITQIHLGAGK